MLKLNDQDQIDLLLHCSYRRSKVSLSINDKGEDSSEEGDREAITIGIRNQVSGTTIVNIADTML
jgi:hypothetical protein